MDDLAAGTVASEGNIRRKRPQLVGIACGQVCGSRFVLDGKPGLISSDPSGALWAVATASLLEVPCPAHAFIILSIVPVLIVIPPALWTPQAAMPHSRAPPRSLLAGLHRESPFARVSYIRPAAVAGYCQGFAAGSVAVRSLPASCGSSGSSTIRSSTSPFCFSVACKPSGLIGRPLN